MKNLFHRILVLAPVNTLSNWFEEYRNWTPPELRGHTNVRLLVSSVPEKDRIKMLKAWYDEGGVLIMGYEMFRLMTGDPDKKDDVDPGGGFKSKGQLAAEKKNLKQIEARKYLMKPGPDIVVRTCVTFVYCNQILAFTCLVVIFLFA
jgi:SNF2 family DNA or RNA helicase